MPLFKKKPEKQPAAVQKPPKGPVAGPTNKPPPPQQVAPPHPSQGTQTARPPGPARQAQPVGQNAPPPPRERAPVITGADSEIANGESNEKAKHPQPAVMSIEEAKASLMREMSDEDNKYGDLGTASGSGKLTSTGLATKSRICKTLTEVLHDNGALPYFIQYMEMLDAVHLVQFWLATESFSTASWQKLRTDAFKNATKHQNLTRNSMTSNDNGDDSSTTTTSKTDGVKSDENANNDLLVPIESNAQPSAKNDSSLTTTSPSSETQDNSSNNSVKSHSRTKSDSVTLGKSVSWKDPGTESPGHKRNHSSMSWKGVDSRTAVERDATNIYTWYICKDASHPVNVSEEIRIEVIAKMCPTEGTVNPDCFKTAQLFVFDVMDKQYFPHFLKSDYHCKYQIDVLTSGKIYLADILDHDTATFHFMEYLEQEDAVHLLQFWLAAENFQQHLLSQQGQYDGMEAQSDAMVLYDQYFSLQATHPIGFDDNIRLEVESNICRKGGPLPDCFSTPMRRAYTTLETVYFPGFLQSELYYKFLSELINTVKPGSTSSNVGTQLNSETDNKTSKASANKSAVPGGDQKPGVKGQSQQNTLLAEGNVKKLFDESDMDIDWGLLDPDSLWQRPDSGSMKFGSINHLGQFVAEYEPDPDLMHKKSHGSKFSLKKLMSKDEDPAKEEMALKIAQKIINDVNIQTGSSSGSSTPQHQSSASGSVSGSVSSLQPSGSPTISRGARRKGSASSQRSSSSQH